MIKNKRKIKKEALVFAIKPRKTTIHFHQLIDEAPLIILPI
ncbi:hypothetical protein [Bacillus cereus]|nr:hypothetical protein [Bacillus cereus]